MAKVLYIFPCLLLSFVSFSQNLIPNPSFEINTELPSDIGLISLCSDWGNAGSLSESSDYFHTNGGLLADLPATPVATVAPLQGDAIIGFVACGKLGSDYREYIDVKLNQPLEIGKKYKMTFNITNGFVHDFSLGGYATDNFGVVFSESRLNQVNDQPLVLTPDFQIDEVFFSREWETLTFVYTATKAAEWMTIGVFGDDSDKQIEFREGELDIAKFAYYFLDDFSLTIIDDSYIPPSDERESDAIPSKDESGTTEIPFFVPNAFTPDGNGYNDTFQIISSRKQIEFSVCVFDRWGNEIYSARNSQPEWDGECRGSKCPTDVYIWLIRYSEPDENGKLVEKESSGSVHLIR